MKRMLKGESWIQNCLPDLLRAHRLRNNVAFNNSHSFTSLCAFSSQNYSIKHLHVNVRHAHMSCIQCLTDGNTRAPCRLTHMLITENRKRRGMQSWTVIRKLILMLITTLPLRPQHKATHLPLLFITRTLLFRKLL